MSYCFVTVACIIHHIQTVQAFEERFGVQIDSHQVFIDKLGMEGRILLSLFKFLSRCGILFSPK